MPFTTMAYHTPPPAAVAGESTESSNDHLPMIPSIKQRCNGRRRLYFLLGFLAVLLLVASAVSAAILARPRPVATDAVFKKKPSLAISRTCGRATYPSLCITSLVDFPGAMDADESDLVHISVNMTLMRAGDSLYAASGQAFVPMDNLSRAAYDDCIELLDDSFEQLSQSLSAMVEGGVAAGEDDVTTWLSAALTNQDTCGEGLGDAAAHVRESMEAELRDLAEHVSNSLAIYATSPVVLSDGGGRRRRLLDTGPQLEKTGFPGWLSAAERRLLDTPVEAMQGDFVVSKDGGNGTYTSIAAAIKEVPEKSGRRTIIYVRAGRYEEPNLKVGRKVMNVMFIGEGKGKTIISGSRSVHEHYTTFHTASFAATGAGFIARDITFENTAGPAKGQAVALRVGADHAVIYRCSIIGYQDTLYVHSNRQFYRDCDIYGTVDFIFGNAAVVLQNCNIYARKPMAMHKITITAQGRKDPNQNTGISIHNCQILATSDLKSANYGSQTYLGRPWKMYSRVVYMLSYMDNHINPAGWLPWTGDFALKTLYYGEYMNNGPGAGTGKRVGWPGYRVIKLPEEADRFTVAKFIYGSSWLPASGVAFLAGLST